MSENSNPIILITPPTAAQAYKRSALKCVRDAQRLSGVAGAIGGAWLADMLLKVTSHSVDAWQVWFGAAFIAGAVWLSIHKNAEAERMGEIIMSVRGDNPNTPND